MKNVGLASWLREKKKRNKLRIYPVPGAGPRVPLDEDVLRGGSGASDAVDGLLVQHGDDRVVLIVELVVGVEDDVVVARVALGHRRPPCLEPVAVRDDVAVVAPEVVRVDDGVGAPDFRGRTCQRGGLCPSFAG
jgi:hypothetical protein